MFQLVLNNYILGGGRYKLNYLIETGLINEVTCGDNFAYNVNDNNAFLTTEYKVLQSHSERGFVKCMKLLYNGKIQLYYLTNGLKSLKNMASTFDAESFLTVIIKLFGSIIEVKNNGFLSCKNIDISFEHIFIDPSTYDISLVYLPLSKRLYSDTAVFENELRTGLIKFIQSEPSLSTPKTRQFTFELSNGNLSLEDICNKMRGVSVTERKIALETIVHASQKSNMKIIAINAPVHFEIEITKDEFILGKKQELVDGVISFNRMISRVHCKITRNGNQYAITDLESANGTYVNIVRIKPNQPCPIKNGDVIRLANSEFQVTIG